MRRRMVGSHSPIVGIELLQHETADVDMVAPEPEVVLQVPGLGAARINHAVEQRSQFFSHAVLGDKDGDRLHCRHSHQLGTCLLRNARISFAMASPSVSSAKWPASSR